MRHDPSHDLETAEPSPSLLAALDITEKELAERELAEQREQAAAEAVCVQSLARKEGK
jgi:hypothetical protein